MLLRRGNRTFLGFLATSLIAGGSTVFATGCSGGDLGDGDPTGSTPQDLNNPAGTAFFYFRSNSTDWNVDEGSRLLPTGDPNVFSRTINYKLTYDDPTVITEAIASGPDQWGTQQIYFSTSGQAKFVVPGSMTLNSGASAANFNVHYSHTGSFVASFNKATGVLTIGTPVQDAGVDANTGHDAGVNVDAGQDAGHDASVDAGVDSGHDAGVDTGIDTGVDTGIETGVDAGFDATVDAGTDAGFDSGSDAEVTTGLDAGFDSGFDSGSDGGTGGGTWQPLSNQPSFAADTSLILTDGRVAVHVYMSPNWWVLTPDANGNYVNGTWSELASMPSNYGPLYFGSAVLPDGRLIVEGGEYNLGSQVWTNLGAIYDPLANAWTAVAPPSGWSSIGDAESVVLANGTFMLANSLTEQQALFNPSTLGWTTTGTNKADGNDEEGWNLLPSGQVLTVDAVNIPESELYDPIAGSWSLAGNTGVLLVDVSSEEIGPAVLLPTGKVFATGGTQHTSVYDPTAATWTPGPDFPAEASGPLDVADGPAALLPNGRVLVAASPDVFGVDTHFFEYDGTKLNEVARTPNAPNESSYQTRFLILPSGQIFEVDGSSDVEIYTPTGSPNPAWAPTISTVASTLIRGTTFLLHGTQINGLSQGAEYGDDAQMASNYPLVRITNNATGHMFFARTHDHSTMGLATGTADVSTSFDVPAAMETGASTIAVVANGIASSPVPVTVQ
ncbi:MAG TPA: hypothetical protein VK841_10640 [Polyangiaceae bacterium]|nr:hypothetical protein [Polyangiaceae bacterium]